MAAFRYEAILQNGKTETGMLQSDSLRAARSALREKGLLPVSVELVQSTSPKSFSFFRKRKAYLTIKERVLLTRQLATLLAAGLPIEEAISACAEQSEKTETRGLILAVRSKILEGHSLANALKEFPQAFSPVYTATVAAGEKTGHLDHVLKRLADHTEKQFAMRKKLQHAMIYPMVMTLVALSITGFLLEFVVPRMITVYTDSHQTLPLLTQFLIALSNGLSRWGGLMLAFIVGSILLLRFQLRRSEGFKSRFHSFLLRIPLLGWAIRISSTARFSSTFAILSAAGVSVLEAMRIASTLVTTLPIRTALHAAVDRVREGANIHLALKQTTYFSPMTLHMIASGEASGQLENMLERTAESESSDLTQFIDTALSLSEPLIILLMGGIVLFIVLAVLLPIFQLDQISL